MANNPMLVEERARKVGSFMVGRLLPFRKKRQVGPFTFIDHMGPATLGQGHYSDVDQHPHIGLSTLTYLFEGSIEHRDSAGHVQEIGPGDVGFMTSGSGITHTERTPQALRGQELPMHGYQIWVALPQELEEMDPIFQYLSVEELPSWEEGNLRVRLVAGEGYGQQSPLKVHSKLFMVDVKAEGPGLLDVQDSLKGEIAIVVVKGHVQTDGEYIEQGQMLVSEAAEECCLNLEAGTRLLLFGGEPFPEPRYLFWNFVSSRKERLEQAKEDWAARRFPQVPGDDTYIPMP